MKKDKRPQHAPALDKARVLALLGEHVGATKRDLVRLLGLKGSDRILLKRILKDLEADGAIEGHRKSGLTKPGQLPEVVLIEVSGVDRQGELLGKPINWDDSQEAPEIYIHAPKVGIAPGPGDRLLVRLEKHGGTYEARIIRRLEREPRSRLIGVLHENPVTGWQLLPIDKKMRTEYRVDKSDLGGAKHNELVLAEPRTGRIAGFGRVKVVERIASMDSPKAISLIAIHDHGIPTEFPTAVIEQARAARLVDPKGRTDLRNIPLMTIDPPDARDHDDAIWAGPDPDETNRGGYVVWVAIADVAYYVTPGSALDKEALKRGNSVYFPDRVVPMLPEALSADLCSLKEGQDRPCLAVRMVFDRHGRKKSHLFQRAIMRSAARLTYAQAQAAFDGEPDAEMNGAVRAALGDVWQAYKCLTVARQLRDPLNLDLPERRVILGPDGKVASIAYRERLESMKLIEEFMVLANVAAAEALEKAKTPLIYRVHDTPSKEKLYAFSDFLRTLNISFAKGQVVKPGTFNRILAHAKGKPHEAVMNDIVLRSQAQAIYDPTNIGHFGLNLAKYAHFTSPIRRYADLIVHRALIRSFKLGDDGLTDHEMERLGSVAEHITMTERRAMAAERDSTDRYVAAFMQDRVGATFDARVTGVTRFGLFVRIAETGTEGIIPIRSLGADYFHHDEKRQALMGQRTKTRYGLGDMVKVELKDAQPLTGGLTFALAGGSGSGHSAHKRRPGKPAKTPKKDHFRGKKR